LKDVEAIVERARRLTPFERQRFADWRAGPNPSPDGLWSERAMALAAAFEAARAAGSSGDQIAAMDRAYQAVVDAAGVGRSVSYFADVRGPTAEWEPAAAAAAEAAAAVIVADSISPILLAFLLEPWERILGYHPPDD
jgi:hypothetical protein